MEKLEKINEFIRGSGSGAGEGSGEGWGTGAGYSAGISIGSGYGAGIILGSGAGTGIGSGSLMGEGEGWSIGDGIGEGWGTGLGAGFCDAIKIKKLNKDLVFYIDEVPTIIDKVRGNIAKGKIVDYSDFSTKECFIAKNGRYFAHESTIREAVESVQNKVYASMDIDSRIAEFRNKFKVDIEYNANDFYQWHNILTGSCEMGRKHFIENNNVDMNKKYKVNEFIQICEDAYGGEVIKRLKEYYV